MSEQKFDVFLAHNSLDKPLVRIIAEELKQFDITSWLDEERILPGQYFQDSLQEAISHVNSAAICIGRAGLGRWQRAEIRAFISQEILVIPVLLPGVREFPEDNIFLKEANWVSFADGIDNEKSILLLAQGIKQKKINGDESLNRLVLSDSADTLRVPLNDWQYEDPLLKNSRKKKEFITRQLSEHIDEFKEYLETVQSQKESVERKLEEIKNQIASIESRLSREKSKHLLSALNWLKENQKRLAKSAGDLVVKSEYSKKEISGDGGSKKFYWVLEKLVETVHYCLLTDNGNMVLSHIEALSISPLHIEHVREAAYHIQKRIDKEGFPLEIRKRVNISIDEIAKCLEILQENIG